MGNFHDGYLEQGTPLGMVTLDLSLAADNTVVDVSNYSAVRITSNDTTAGNRTFTITNGPRVGQMLFLTLVSGSSTTCQLADSGNVALSAAWEPLQNDTLTLVWQGTVWVEMCRADN